MAPAISLNRVYFTGAEVHCNALGAAPFFASCSSSHAQHYDEGHPAVDTQQDVAFLNAATELLQRTIRKVYQRHAIKRLARLLDVPTGTSHSLIHKRLSKWRLPVLAEALLQELYRESRDHVALCIELETLTGRRNGKMGNVDSSVVAAGTVSGKEAVDPLLAAARWLAERASK